MAWIKLEPRAKHVGGVALLRNAVAFGMHRVEQDLPTILARFSLFSVGVPGGGRRSMLDYVSSTIHVCMYVQRLKLWAWVTGSG